MPVCDPSVHCSVWAFLFSEQMIRCSEAGEAQSLDHRDQSMLEDIVTHVVSKHDEHSEHVVQPP